MDIRDAVLLGDLTETYNSSVLDFVFHRSNLRSRSRRAIQDIDAPITKAVNKGYYDITEQLLWAGASVDYPDKYGWTPLVMAARQGMLNICQLLRSGANIHASDSANAVHKAIIYSHHDIVALFLNHGPLHFHSKAQLSKWSLHCIMELHRSAECDGISTQ